MYAPALPRAPQLHSAAPSAARWSCGQLLRRWQPWLQHHGDQRPLPPPPSAVTPWHPHQPWPGGPGPPAPAPGHAHGRAPQTTRRRREPGPPRGRGGPPLQHGGGSPRPCETPALCWRASRAPVGWPALPAARRAGMLRLWRPPWPCWLGRHSTWKARAKREHVASHEGTARNPARTPAVPPTARSRSHPAAHARAPRSSHAAAHEPGPPWPPLRCRELQTVPSEHPAVRPASARTRCGPWMPGHRLRPPWRVPPPAPAAVS